MATTPREKYHRRLKTFEKRVDEGRIGTASADAIRELLNAYDEDSVTVPKPPGESHRAPGTLNSWLYRLMAFAYERDLTTTAAHDLNQDVEAMQAGTHSAVQEAGIQKSTLRSYQAALRRFYRYHDFAVAPEEIPLYDQKANGFDPNDILTKEEIAKARKAAGNPRDKLIFDLALYTGQRREALRTLRVKDVDHMEGVYRLNATVDGLKNYHEPQGKRPLLAAKASVRDWVEEYHSDPAPDNYLITARPGYSQVDPSEPVSGETIRKVMQNIKEASGIEKPMHPHMMRHNFVTICKRDYEMPDDTIKYLIGHSDSSNVMESTYSHLSGDDHVKRAEEAAGVREPEPQSSFTPDACRICGNPLGPNDKACNRCGMVYAPDARVVKEQLDADVKASFKETDPGDTATMEKIDALDELLNDPEVKAALLEKLGTG